MIPWRAAGSLLQLRDQLRALYPNRATASDGMIGDAAHAATVSDHNPDAGGVVRAFDITHDPARGVDGNWLAGQLLAHRDPRVKYVIWNRRIFAGNAGPAPWQWRPYAGSDPHTNHVHLSVVPGAAGDTRASWKLAPTTTTPQEVPEVITPDDVKRIASAAADAVWSEVLPRLDNPVGATAKTQLTAANVYSWRNNQLLKTLTGDQAKLRAAIASALADAPDAPEVDVDALARSIVRQLVEDTAQ